MCAPKACPLGSWVSCEGKVRCDNCTAGRYCPQPTVSVLCPAGSFCGPAASSPTPCPAGSFCRIGESVPRPCRAGFYCPAAATMAIMCPAGSFCAGGASAPQPCPTAQTAGASSC